MVERSLPESFEDAKPSTQPGENLGGFVKRNTSA
jgi:hypothetical protein